MKTSTLSVVIYMPFNLLFFVNFFIDAKLCNEYFKNDNEIICTKLNRDNTVYYLQNNTKVGLNCHNEHYTDYSTKEKTVRSVNCTFEEYGEPSIPSSEYDNLGTILQEDTLANLCEVEEVNFGYANIEIIEPNTFQCLKDIKRLFLYKNKIQVLPADLFKDLHNLGSLDMSFNRITTLPKGIFDPLSNVIDLVLNDNDLEILDPQVFSGMIEVKFMNLSNNKLKRLDAIFPPDFVVLEIANNSIESISDDAFSLSDLATIDLSLNRLKKIPLGMFGHLSGPRTLNLAFNRISELVDQPFRNNIQMNSLNLQGNRLSEIKNGDFRGLQSLRTLHLNSNGIRKIASDSFGFSPNLNYLNLDSNLLSSLPSSEKSMFFDKKFRNLILSNNYLKNLSNVFDNTYVYTLELRNNVGLVLNSNTFVGLKHLNVLNLEGCDVTTLPDDIFANLPNMTEMYLRNNNIRVIRPGTLAPLKNINILDLSYNKIEKLSNYLFSNNILLRLLNLSNNNIKGIEDLAFRGLNQTSWELDISSNELLEFPLSDLTLEILNISDNGLSSLNGIIDIDSLVSIDISYNNLSHISKAQWIEIVYMDKFVASHNLIDEVNMEDIYDTKTDCAIHLEGNKITKILIPNQIDRFSEENSTTPHNVDKTLKLCMVDNPIKCDCFAYNVFQYLNNYNHQEHYLEFYDDLVCHNPLNLRGKKLKEVKAADLTCNFMDDSSNFQCVSPGCVCQQNCSCLFRPYDDSRILNCSNNEYSELPLDVPLDTHLLYMDHNNITSLQQLNETVWEHLKEIHVEFNAIESADFRIPENVTYLGLKGNEITVFPMSIQTHAKKVKDLKLTLSKNCWPCDCSILPLKRFLLIHENKVIDSDDITCAFPNSSVAILKKLSDIDLCPMPPNTVRAIVLNAIGIIAILISVAASIFYFTHRQYVLSMLYTHFNGCYRVFCRGKKIEDNKSFDGFISYSSTDREVTLAIMEELELKPPGYKFCIHERNWLAGSYITDNISNSVQNSRKTLIIISKTFLKSEWFQTEFQTAFQQTLEDRIDRLILILKGDLPDKSELPDDLQYVLRTKTYLEWGERWFFEKLRYALHEQRPFVGEKKLCSFASALNCLRSRKAYPQHVMKV